MKALVLLNMGGARQKSELELFLRNMFNDKNIITIKSDFFRSIIASFIVSSRKNSAWENYEKIGGKSPIYDLTDELVKKLEAELGDEFYVTYAMRYTPPFANECVKHLEDKNIKDVVLLPLYPQYSTTTTKSSVEDFVEFSQNKFDIRVIEPFYKDKDYNLAIIDEIKRKSLNSKDYNLIFSAHGLPQKIVDKGDPYQKQLQEQVDILKALLKAEGMSFNSISLAYQSKVGPMKWLEPSLEDVLQNFTDKKVIIYPISFIVDNSETVFELAIEYEEIAKDLNISEYVVCECLNSNEKFIKSIKNLIK